MAYDTGSKSPEEGGSATQTRTPPRAWSDLEISQFKEGVIVHGWSGWAAIAKDFTITRSQRQVGDYASKWKAKYPEEYEQVIQVSRGR